MVYPYFFLGSDALDCQGELLGFRVRVWHLEKRGASGLYSVAMPELVSGAFTERDINKHPIASNHKYLK